MTSELGTYVHVRPEATWLTSSFRSPLVGQTQGYDGKPLLQPDAQGKLSPHGQMACWYAAATMVSYYYRAGPRNGLPAVWKPDKGLQVVSITQLAAAEGLLPVPVPAGGLTPASLGALLTQHGPLRAAGRFARGGLGHVIVLTGIRGSTALFNDPAGPAARAEPLAWVSTNLLPVPNALFGKDRTRS